MKAICYRNTVTNLPNWDKSDQVHISQPLGFAYESETHFIHLYGWEKSFKGLSIGLTVIEGKVNDKSLEEWVKTNFGAVDIKQTKTEIGHSIRGVWRPGLYFNTDVIQAIGTSEQERFLSEQAIRVLIHKLDEIFFFVEPNTFTKNTYSHKIRELLILACTEIENFWNLYLIECKYSFNRKGFTTNDYIKLKDKLFLNEFEFNLTSYPELGSIRPFENWSSTSPTQSLFWYDAYNKTKHNRTINFQKANLWNAINALVGCLIMHCVRFGPYSMFENNNQFSTVIKQHFTGKLTVDCIETFYIPKIELNKDIRSDKLVFDPKRKGMVKEYIVNDFKL